MIWEITVKKTIFIKNAIILTAASLILRFAGIIFKVWLSALIGSEGIGLYQLVFSFYVLASTFATSGIRTAVTRLIAEELSLGCKKGTLQILRRSLQLTLIISAISLAIIYFGADFIAIKILGDARCALAIKILPFSLPFMGLTSCLRGYFIATRSVTPNAVSQIFEQSVRIISISLIAKKFIKKGIAYSCAAVMIGDIAAEILASILLFIIFLFSKRSLNMLKGRDYPPYKVTNKIINISLPITSGRYLNSALRTVENILVPKNLGKFALNSSKALSQFGMIKGMALPILFFPSALLNSISTLLIPEISEAAAKNQKGILRTATSNIIKLTSLISYIFAAIFFIAGRKIGILIYKSEDVGFLLSALSPIIPFMYLDSISDGILKGLDQQNFSFRTAVSDSLFRIILILLVVPISGLNGFIRIMYLSNFYTCFLTVGRLIKLTKITINYLKEIFLPLSSALTVTLILNFFLNYFSVENNLVYIILLCAFSLPLYLLLLLAFGVTEKSQILHYFS